MSEVAGLVLAAGAGSRFGRPKAVVELDGERLVDRAGVDPAGLDLLREVLVRPPDHHLVGVGEPRRGGEDRAGVAHGDLVAEEGPHPATAAAKSIAPKTSIRGRGA